MKHTHVTYIAKPERAEENAGLIRAVFEELRLKSPDGLKYMVLRRGDGRFIHFVEQRDGAPRLADFEAFRAFQKHARDRIQGGPEVNEVQVVGVFGFKLDTA